MYRTILVLVDGSPTSRKGLDEAIRLAQITKGRLRLFHVIEIGFALSMDAHAGGAGDRIDQLRTSGHEVLEASRAMATKAGIEADTVLCEDLTGTLHDIVADEVAKSHIDLIVLGTHGRGGLDRAVLGSNAEQILRHASVPVLLVHAGERYARTKTPNESLRVTLPSGALAFE